MPVRMPPSRRIPARNRDDGTAAAKIPTISSSPSRAGSPNGPTSWPGPSVTIVTIAAVIPLPTRIVAIA